MSPHRPEGGDLAVPGSAGLSRPGLRGREAELQQLRALVEAVRDGTGGAVALLLGEPGIGKTVLLQETVSIARAHGFVVSHGRAEELHELAPLASLASGLLHGDPPLLSSKDFADLAGHHDQRIWLVERLAQLIEERSAGTPVLVAVDDVQWADPLSRFALSVMPARLLSSPVLWLLTGRNDPELYGQGPRTTTLPLRPLSDTALAELARDVLGGDVPTQVAELVDGAGGNPFLATEMLTGIVVSGADGPEPPERLVLGVRDRLAALRPDTLHFLRIGSVLGRAFSLADAAALCGRPAWGLSAEVDEAIAAALLHDDGERLVFRHDLLRQAVYADLAPSVRRALHREAASRLVAVGRSSTDAVPHLLKSAEPGDQEAIGLLGTAATDVLAAMPDLAADLAVRALELVPPHAPMLFDVGERAIVALTRAGRYTQARVTGDRLLARQPPLDVFARLQSVLGDTLWHLDDVHELTRRSTAALVAVTDPVVRARLTARQALARSRGRDLQAAREAGERALTEAELSGDREARVLALWGLGEIALNAGDCAAAVEHHTALSVFDTAFLPEEAVARIHVDDFDTVRRLLRTAGDAPLRPAMLMWAQATLHMGLGRLDDADADLVTAERLEADLHVPGNLVNIRVNRGLLAILRGDREAAREHLDVVRATMAERPNTGNHATHQYFEAVVADADGHHAAAAERLRSVQRDHPFLRWRLLRPHVVQAVQIALRGGDRALAQDLAAQAAEHATRNPFVPTAQGTSAHAAGLVNADHALLERSVHVLLTGPRPLPLAAASADLGRALLASGDPAATPALTRAHDIYAQAGADAEADRVRADPAQTASRSRRSTGGRRPRPGQGWDALTASERKVARLIAAGHTNRSAAQALVVSPHTVNTHLASIFRKLSVRSRVHLARIVLAQGDAGPVTGG
ncbi:helix-turn-helix transcriptional regulator [Streptomyces candidus]|uniref:DNA-binding CsgD family transcriptional regulator/tetratricopeptide (TPR) repeat protein n=1 Tax=Streptomyces candidus TaxID=67283 RepID=A0A7X0HJY6_9ACTN|nr:LuxR family transcriptional regulator [Streptomyces candidus]MBB6438873.1 DNA-binding CsgD family transcriptional regulator/tetratricopeptide (TPR) repeat protein [Streptomyces candidus]GHH52635.1 LuxR family transcriptional regulator [Streptomyces candidus]